MGRVYLKIKYPDAVSGGKTLLTGIRQLSESLYLMTGFYSPPESAAITFVYIGTEYQTHDISRYHLLSYPSSENATVLSTNLYGPYVLENGNIRVVGNYFTQQHPSRPVGCMYEGYPDGSGIWTTLTPDENSIGAIMHSTYGKLVVGNYETLELKSTAVIYNVSTGNYTHINYPAAKDITAYGVWKSDSRKHKCRYTICGGMILNGIEIGYVVDFNNATGKFKNWRLFEYSGNAQVTHFDGISGDNHGGYYLVGDAIVNGKEKAFIAHLYKCGSIKWRELSVPSSTSTSGNSVANKTAIGVFSDPQDPSIFGYISTFNEGSC